MLFWMRIERGLTDVCVLPERVAGVLPFKQAVLFEQAPAFERLSFRQLDPAKMTGVLNLAPMAGHTKQEEALPTSTAHNTTYWLL